MHTSELLGRLSSGHVHPLSPRGLRVRLQQHPWTWPVVAIRDTWLTAVESEVAILFNLRLLAVASVVLSTPDVVTGAVQVFGDSGPRRWFGVYVLSLGLAGMVGGTLLYLVPRVGRVIILAAAAGAYLEAVLGLGRFEQSFFALVLYVASMAAEAWVVWFLLHPRTRAHLRLHGRRTSLGST